MPAQNLNYYFSAFHIGIHIPTDQILVCNGEVRYLCLAVIFKGI
jgi:hypothetical protein